MCNVQFGILPFAHSFWKFWKQNVQKDMFSIAHKKGMMLMKVGIDIGGSHIAIGVIDNRGKILDKHEKRITSIERQNIEQFIQNHIIEQVSQLKQEYDNGIEEIGIGMPGYAENGVIITSGNVGIKNYNLAEALQQLKLPIKIRNDAKCAALAEHAYGCLKGYERSVFLTLGTGIGGAVFVGNELLKAGKRPGYELGHMIIEKNGIPCHCGQNGCFERYASMKVFKNNLREALHLDETTRGEELLEIIRKNVPNNKDYQIIETIVAEYIENLSIGIQNLIRIFEPEVIGIGGSFVYFEDVFLQRLKSKIYELNRESKDRNNVEIKVAILGNDSGMIGAVL